MNRKRLPRILIALAGVLGLVVIGFGGIWFRVMGGVARLSYDVPFRWRGHIETLEARIIYIDEKSAAALQQGEVWDRTLHARLLDKLRQDGARAVFFDIVFIGSSKNPASDEVFAAAIKEHGNVFLGGAMDISSEGGQYMEKLTPPAAILRRAAAGWGLLVFRPIDPDYGVRQIYTGTEQKASAAWVAAQKLGAKIPDTDEERSKKRWLNYYGPHGWLRGISYVSALNPSDTPPGFFKDKVVFIGSKPTVGPLSLGKDEFATPYVHWILPERNESLFSPGVEIHATALLNLLRGDWLTRLPQDVELTLVILCGVCFGTLFSLLRPIPAVFTGISAAAILTGGAFWLMWEKQIWFSWIVPVGIQIPVGLSWSLGANYILELRRRNALRRAFAHYLSPQMADRIANSEFDLRPGGELLEVTVVFTDLEGFTALSESLGDPERLSAILTDYFTRTTEHVFENDGTISKYIGDAVMAFWGAPLKISNHAATAALASQRLLAASKIEVDGKPLRTRIGIHTGRALVGNLGSNRRFDYTVIGDVVNFASRLEGLNKYLGTDILISESTCQQLPSEFTARKLGAFRVAGKTTSVQIYELLPEHHESPPDWLADFEEGVAAYAAGNLTHARQLFENVIDARGTDGPSSFYLKKIIQNEGLQHENWTGIIEFSSK